MNIIVKKIKRNPVSAAFGVGILACLAISNGNIQQNMRSLSAVREEAQRNNASDMMLHASQEAAQQQAEIAKSRYKAGCVMVVAMKDPNYYTSLTEGQPVLDRIRHTPLPAGTIVCDANGNTAKIVKVNGQPVVGELAYTGDQSVVEAARKRHTNHKYSLPDQ